MSAIRGRNRTTRSSRGGSTSTSSTTPTSGASGATAGGGGGGNSKENNVLSCPLYMECEEEGLSPAQKAFSKDRKAKFVAQMMQLEKLARSGAGSTRVTSNPDGTVTFRVTETETISAPVPGSGSGSGGGGASTAAPPSSGVRLVMDPRTGRILGTINGNAGRSSSHTTSPATPGTGNTAVRMPGHRIIGGQQQQPATAMIRSSIQPTSIRSARPPVVRQPQVVDLTRGVPHATAAANKNSIPALLVTPKPSKTIPNLSVKRSELDSKVKSLLVHSPSKFTEWLIQQGLVPADQFEIAGGVKVKLKLGMYSDAKKFPYSGGYVWINEANQSKFISVYRGSVFEATNHAPTIVLKLMYHWACQTNTTNVIQWVKVDSGVIHQYYQLFRAVCTIAVQEEIVNMGGNGKIVQIGVISLGTTSGEGSKREVRVEVLGVLEVETGRIRLRATEPAPAQGISQSERFARIFEPLPIWVSRNSKIVTDYSVDKDRLIKLGYTTVSQCSVNNKRPDTTNAAVMDYLKRTVPRMFQNNLSYLSTNQIQQFLDELTFREMNNYPLACFDNLLSKISNITTSLSLNNEPIVPHLRRVLENPFGDWRLTHQLPPLSGIDALPPSLRMIDHIAYQRPAPGSKRGSSDFNADIDKQINKRIKVASELVNLESYFYATLQGDVQVLSGEFKADMAFKCHLCKKVYMNNIEFMKHLCLHIESDRANAVDLADLCQCKYCYKDFETPFAMQSHLEDQHLKKGSDYVCRICTEAFKVENHLIHHMTKTHVRSEMPYVCNVCAYRSSSHRDLIDHFQEIHDRTDKLQCPRCLKTYSLFGDKGYNSNVASSFISHIQAHQDKKGYSCKKCSLSFQTADYLKNHVDRDHASFKGFDNLEPYEYLANEKPILMPKPDERLARTAAKKSGLIKVQPQSAFAAQNLEDMLMYNVDREDCGECKKKIMNPGHFAAYLCCTKCRYSTCCSKAISVHVNIFHGPAKPTFSLGLPFMLEKDVFCCCGFKTKSGNKMAKHLGVSGCLSAYPTKEEAKAAQRASASFAPLISIDEDDANKDPSVAMAEAYRKSNAEDSSKKPFYEGPLAFLGLQRKSIDEEKGTEKEETDEKSETAESKDEEVESKAENSKSKTEENKSDNESPEEKAGDSENKTESPEEKAGDSESKSSEEKGEHPEGKVEDSENETENSEVPDEGKNETSKEQDKNEEKPDKDNLAFEEDDKSKEAELPEESEGKLKDSEKKEKAEEEKNDDEADETLKADDTNDDTLQAMTPEIPHESLEKADEEPQKEKGEEKVPEKAHAGAEAVAQILETESEVMEEGSNSESVEQMEEVSSESKDQEMKEPSPVLEAMDQD